MSDIRKNNRNSIAKTLIINLNTYKQDKDEYIRSLESQIAEMKKVELDLKRLAIVVQDSNDAITLQDLNGNILTWNRGAAKIYGFTEQEALKMNISQLIPEDRKNEMKNFIKMLKKKEHVESIETQRKTKNGSIVDICLTVTPIREEKGEIKTIATTERDITEKNKLIKELASMSILDDLTGLYNRRGFNIFSNQLLKIIKRQKSSFLLLYMDLDNLKWINDNMGHIKGDEYIKKFATILKETFRETDVVSRLGGDEFAVMTEVSNDDKIKQKTIDRLKDKIKNENNKDKSMPISASIGGFFGNYDLNLPMEDIIKKADNEMYNEKKQKNSLSSLIRT